MGDTRREMRGPSFNMDPTKMNQPQEPTLSREELRVKMKNKLGQMSVDRMGYHAQTVAQVKQEQREGKREEERKLKEEEEQVKLERKREKNRAKKKKRRERGKESSDCKIPETGLNIINSE